jgi:hypothetical protein
MSDEVTTEEPKKPAAKRKSKAKPKAKPEVEKKGGARKYSSALALRVLYTLDAVPDGNKVKVGRKTVVFTKYARKDLAEKIKAVPSDKAADAKALKLLKEMGGRKYRPAETVESLVAATAKTPRVIPVNPDESCRVPYIGRWFENRRGRKSVKVRYEKKKVTITLP